MATLETDLSITRQWLDLSLAQRAVWLDASLSISSTAYILVRWARFRGEMDAKLALQALTLMVARHDALRLRVDSELPRQWLHSLPDGPFSFLDLSGESNPQQALDARLKAAFAAGLPLGDRWLFSLELIKLGSADYYLWTRCHHLLADEAAVSMILSHWLEAYRALTSDSATELAPPSSYLSIIASDAAYVESSRYKQDLEYWTRRFKSLSPGLIDSHSNEPANSDSPIVRTWLWKDNLYARFAAACTAAAVTPQRTLFALVNVLFARRYGQSDLTIGMALHRRDASNLQVVGMFAGMLPIRCQLRDGCSLIETIADISSQVDRDLRHQRLPVDVLSRELGISRGGLAELFQVAFSFVPSQRGVSGIALDGIDIQSGGIPSKEASPITVHAYELPGKGGLSVDIAAHPGFVDSEEVARIMQLFEACVSQFVTDPDVELDSLPGITPAERSQVTSTWNTTTRKYPTGRAEEFFERRARETPDAVAVLSATASLTYAELNVRSNQFAQKLLQHGLSPQSVVGVALERSVETVLSLLAILKAGCTYLPLDPSYPPDRLLHMLSDSKARLVITDLAISQTLPPGIENILVDDVAEHAEATSAALINGLYSANDAAYIIYTSGSTGKPKGVAVPHTAAVNLAFARLEHDPISTGDRILAAISVGFDVSIGQLLLPLLNGATVVVASDLRTLTPQDFWNFLQDHHVTHINSVPSFFESILDAVPESTSLLRLMLGGEPLSSTLVRRLQKTLPRTQVFNMYGPTEACIDATFYAVTGTESAGGSAHW